MSSRIAAGSLASPEGFVHRSQIRDQKPPFGRHLLAATEGLSFGRLRGPWPLLQPQIQSQEANDFFHMPEVARTIMLGDREKHDKNVYNVIVAAHNAVGEGITKISALTGDQTRNEVQRHAAASIVADRIGVLEHCRENIAKNAARLQSEAADAATRGFAANESRATIQSKIRH